MKIRRIGEVDRDRALARRMLSGDERAFQEFFDRHFPGLYRFALARMGGEADAAEEVAQAALCKAIHKLATYRGEAMLFTWLCTFCRHEISAHYRRRGRAPEAVPLAEDDPEVRAALSSLGALLEGPEVAVRRKEVGRLVQVVLDHLPSRYGDALEWKYLEGIPVKEIGERLGIGPKAAESLLTRARQAFRDGFTSLIRTPEVLGGASGDRRLPGSS
jgi:RNA polymerase sigma-70 factor (ECF subfamily)